MLKLSLCDYSDAYILVIGIISIAGAGADVAAPITDKRNKQVTRKSVPFTNCISQVNNI